MIFALLFLIPVTVLLVGYIFFHTFITYKEIVIQLVICAVVLALSLLMASEIGTYDKEILNGRVTEKHSERVHCRHAYPCHCRPVSCGKNCTTIHCDVCFAHSYDVDWIVESTIGSVNISTIDSQGLQEPPRWTQAKIGERFSDTSTYKSYIKGNKSLFVHVGQEDKYFKLLNFQMPTVHDYYRCDSVVMQDGIKVDKNEWNKAFNNMNAEIGKEKECNISVIVLQNMEEDFFYALEEKLEGGKKNDIIIVINVSEDNSIKWSNVMCWTKNAMVKVKIKNDLNEIGSINNLDQISTQIKQDIVDFYQRKSMKEFEYLKASHQISGVKLLVISLIMLILSISLTIFFIVNDIEEFSFLEER